MTTGPQPALVSIARGRTRAHIAPEAGGRLHQLEVFDGSAWLPLLVAPRSPAASLREPLDWSSYPMLPWVNRIEAGRFTWRGRLYMLPPAAEGNALHGLGPFQPWRVESSTAAACAISTSFDCRWPFGGRAVQTFAVADTAITQRIELHATRASFPAGVGWHPWFRRDVRPGAAMRVTVDASHRYETDAMIPTGWLLRATGDHDLRSGPAIGSRRLDTCYRHPRGDLRVRWDDLELTMRSSPNVGHAVVYTSPRGVCVEPMTAAIDAFNLLAQGIQGVGVQIVRPGRPLVATTRWSWRIS